VSLHTGGRLVGQSTSPTLPQSVVDRAGHCRHLRGSKPPTFMRVLDTQREGI
jgi:hypothetical protein